MSEAYQENIPSILNSCPDLTVSQNDENGFEEVHENDVLLEPERFHHTDRLSVNDMFQDAQRGISRSRIDRRRDSFRRMDVWRSMQNARSTFDVSASIRKKERYLGRLYERTISIVQFSESSQQKGSKLEQLLRSNKRNDVFR